ncbi:MAG TPA: glycoside hydrolase family 3 C-terminal domain-containing protein [Eubacteriales bacterium]|nr:glycoside hydrolase family 3 C-terminal domain-containing protein [Eubacteriales bacterium]
MTTIDKIQREAEQILATLTTRQKAMLLTGRDFWHSNGLDECGLPGILLTDGPHGLRKQEGESDHLGIHGALAATCFPTGCCSACSFDPELLNQLGRALGEEARSEGVGVLLGPSVNIKRSPLGGRNFEYYSEDPLLTGTLAAAFIDGVQSCGVGASIKHFAANSQEKNRMCSDSVVDERALREIYLRGFQLAIESSKPWTVMTAYNMLNGVYCSEHKRLLSEIARDEFGFDGAFVTDWGAVSDLAASYEAGLDLEMPPFKSTLGDILLAIERGELSAEALDARAAEMISLLIRVREGKKVQFSCDVSGHIDLAQRIAEESAVLLKNDGLLPLGTRKLLVAGAFAKHPRYQSTGSSHINPNTLDCFCEALDDASAAYEFEQGYRLDSVEPDEALIARARNAAQRAECVVVFAGLPDICESEGFDRDSLDMPAGHNALIEAVCSVNSNVVVVLQGGSPMAMPWRSRVKAILALHLAGCRNGHAAWNLLCGAVNPSGKLAETWPLSENDLSAAGCFSGDKRVVEYRESIFAGYRYFLTAGVPVAYPFGHGLSYTAFAYSGLRITDTGVEVTVKNTGGVFGRETVQIYLSKPDSAVFRPARELKAFQKVALEPGERRTIQIPLREDAFSFYSPEHGRWVAEEGEYEVLAGSSSQDIRLRATVHRKGVACAKLDYPYGGADRAAFEALLGHTIPQEPKRRPFTLNSPLGTTKGTLLGNLILRFGVASAKKAIDDGPGAEKMARASIYEMPVRNMGMSGGLTRGNLQGMVELFNGHFFRGMKLLSKREKQCGR